MICAACRMTCTAALVVWAGSGFLAAQEPLAAKPKPSREQIAGWVKALDADEFLERETSMLALLDAGPMVLPELEPVLTGGSLEATSRAFFVVRQVGLTGDTEAQEKVSQLLADLAGRKEAPALARRAAAALAELNQQRSLKALAELEALGAKLVRLDAGGGPFDEPVQSIEIGDGFEGQEEDLRRLKWITDVPLLLLTGKKATDGWVKHAAAMPSLEKLHLYQAAITDGGLTPLAGNSTLRELGIYYVAVGDDVLKPLAKLPLLGFIKLYGTRVSALAVEKFRESSGVAVDQRRGAFLGVGCQNMEPCRISTVHPGSPAAKGGLLPEDEVLRFGGKAIKNFDALTEFLRYSDVDDTVEVEVLRQVQEDGQLTYRRVSATLNLAPWDMEAAVQNPRR
jgi:hypothetical protein